MDERKLYFGAYSEETMTEWLKKDYKKINPKVPYSKSEQEAYDKEEAEYINIGLANGVKGATTTFFAKDLSAAKTTAKEMGLKSFSPISTTIYEKGKDF